MTRLKALFFTLSISKQHNLVSNGDMFVRFWLILQLAQALLLSKSLMESQVNRSNVDLIDVFIQRSISRELDTAMIIRLH